MYGYPNPQKHRESLTFRLCKLEICTSGIFFRISATAQKTTVQILKERPSATSLDALFRPKRRETKWDAELKVILATSPH